VVVVPEENEQHAGPPPDPLAVVRGLAQRNRLILERALRMPTAEGVVIDSVGDVIVGVEAPEHWDERVWGPSPR
jgi:hypothetical protein